MKFFVSLFRVFSRVATYPLAPSYAKTLISVYSPVSSIPAVIFPEHYILKVNEFNGVAKDSLDEWIYFFKNSVIEDGFKAKGLAEAREKLQEIKLSAEDLPAYRHYLQNLRQQASIEETVQFDRLLAREEGHEEGKREGKKEGKKEGIIEGKKVGKKEGIEQTAAAMKKLGIDIELIVKATGLSKENIKKLK